jgi:hypothetical protein
MNKNEQIYDESGPDSDNESHNTSGILGLGSMQSFDFKAKYLYPKNKSSSIRI